MKNIVLIDASPKVNERSVSGYLIDMVSKHIQENNAEKIRINIRQSFRKNETEENYKVIIKADALIISFPLYIFCMPGILTRFLQDYYQFYLKHKEEATRPKVYTIVNCGFPEPEINLEAVRVIRSFCGHINADFRFGIQIGCGGMLLGAEGKPIVKKVVQKLDRIFSEIIEDIQNNNSEKKENVSVSAITFPPGIFFFLMNKFGWYTMARRRNGLKRKDLYKKPYLLKL
ncbi:MAG: NAD(P)H-dependent oxidoreductase [Spirochaetes bacterium]|nr:NAD(P)H-dependent oxidoreductase [Spirochaetota bacterium]